MGYETLYLGKLEIYPTMNGAQLKLLDRLIEHDQYDARNTLSLQLIRRKSWQRNQKLNILEQSILVIKCGFQIPAIAEIRGVLQCLVSLQENRMCMQRAYRMLTGVNA
jgi:hypothetical protein